MSWRRLDRHKKPVIFLNTNGYWEPFFALIRHTEAEGFTPSAFLDTYLSVDTVEEVLPAIARAGTHTVNIDTRRVV